MNDSIDPTEDIRRAQVLEINSAVESATPQTERQRLESLYPRVWDTGQLSEDFECLGFMAPYVVVKRKADGVKGSLQFQHSPRFYFNWQPGQ